MYFLCISLLGSTDTVKLINMKTLVVIPAYNEEETIYEVVTRALHFSDVSVTNDGSRDRTPEILEGIVQECKEKKHKHLLHIITHAKSTHIPAGIQDGMVYAKQNSYDFIVTMDAGLSHDPDVLPELFSYDPSIDVLIGSREVMENVPLYRRLISRMAANVVNYSLTPSFFKFRGPALRDCTSGFRRYSRRAFSVVAEADLKSKAFDFHMEALALCYRAGMSVAEFPIKYVFSNSSFNMRVFRQGILFGFYLILHKNSSKTRS